MKLDFVFNLLTIYVTKMVDTYLDLMAVHEEQ
jgi:hypothetical protein